MTRADRRLFVDATPLVPPRLTGVGRVLIGLLRALDDDAAAAGVEVRLVVPWSERRALDRFGFRSLRVRPVLLPRRVWSLVTRLHTPGVDLLLGRGTWLFPNFRNWPLSRSRSLTFVHDVCFAVMPELVPRERREMLERSVPGWLARTQVVLTGTVSSAREVTEALGIEPQRVHVLPTTIDTALFHPRSTEEVDRARRAHRLGRYVLFVGSIERRKNVTTLVRAYAAAERPDGHTLLLIGGDGWENDDVHRAVEDAVASGADVRFAESYVTDAELPALLTGADAVAMPSWHEGFGLPALEAVACGARVLAADIPGLHDALRGREDDAVFLAPSDTHAWAAALERAIREQRHATERPIADWHGAAAILLGLVTAEESPGAPLAR